MVHVEDGPGGEADDKEELDFGEADDKEELDFEFEVCIFWCQIVI